MATTQLVRNMTAIEEALFKRIVIVKYPDKPAHTFTIEDEKTNIIVFLDDDGMVRHEDIT